MTQGIPYFGPYHNSIVEEINSACVSETISYNTMYEMIQAEATKRTVVIIDNKWFSWLWDARFNYREGKAELPYYEYQTTDIQVSKNHSDNKGHLLLNIDTYTWSVRHSYNLKMLELQLNKEITLYDVELHKKYKVIADKWYFDTFDITALYISYLSSAYYDFDELLEKHIGGYHYITRQFKGFNNLEWKKRKELELPNFVENQPTLYDFRDVRQYRREELFGGAVMDTIIPYKFRRLAFDCLLYCIIKQGSKTTDRDFNHRYNQLSKKDCILCYRPNHDAPALIFKSYWYGVGSYENKRRIFKHV